MTKPLIEKTYDGKYAILVGGKKGHRWAPPSSQNGSYAAFDTRSQAENFIKKGGLNEVQVLSVDEASRACGWDDAVGYCEANYARMQEWCEREGVHYYAREKHKFFVSEAIREAQELGLSKVVVENLS